MVKAAASVKDFIVLPLKVSCPPSLQTDVPVTHFLYVKQHAPKVPTPDTPRSLFVANISIDSSLPHFRNIFSDQLGGGRLERITNDGVLHSENNAPASHQKSKKPNKTLGNRSDNLILDLPEIWDRRIYKSGSNLVLVFLDRQSCERALTGAKKASRARQALDWDDSAALQKLPDLGSSRYRKHQLLKYPSALELQSRVDDFMTTYAAQEAQKTNARQRQRMLPDEDGFVTVTRGGRVGPARLEEAQEKLEELKKREERKRQEMESSGFYRFQAREAKKRQAHNLLEQFQSDRLRVEEMARSKKRHKPE